MVNAENRMKRKFPNELKLFYQEIGYGFLCKDDKIHTNRIMHPSDIANFYCEDEVYSYVDRDLYESNEMIFFDLGGGMEIF
ncbi:SMI1/KNR4 family protein [Clostridium estertheticum]|nr:SMI1/KNR4 family protein [Clostridium estertheticum]